MTVEQRLTFGRWFSGLGMAALASIALWVGAQIRDLNASVQKLSRDIAVMAERAAADRARIDRLEARQDRLETRGRQ